MFQQVNENEFECAICMEFFSDPYRIHPCQHIYCLECLQKLQSGSIKHCPQCRAAIQFMAPAGDVQQKMMQCEVTCSECHMIILALSLRQHKLTCPSVQRLQAVAAHSLHRAMAAQACIPAPNRSTFTCPYCGQSNLLCLQLVDHCNLMHSQCNLRVVCPICTSMPWGDPSFISTNFIKHLNLRHKFEYETYVDYDQDDDAMLNAALQASLQDM